MVLIGIDPYPYIYISITTIIYILLNTRLYNHSVRMIGALKKMDGSEIAA
jgi:hypothetical protein